MSESFEYCLWPTELKFADWVASDPLRGGGMDALEAYYILLLASPELLLAAGGFLKSGKCTDRDDRSTVYIVPCTHGTLRPEEMPPLRAGDRIFLDGVVGAASIPTSGIPNPDVHRIISLKERLLTSAGEFLIPENLDLGVWDTIPPDWSGAGDRDGLSFYLFSEQTFLSPANSAYVDFILRRDKGRLAYNWRAFLGQTLTQWLTGAPPAYDLDRSTRRDLRDAFASLAFHRWVVEKTARIKTDPPRLGTVDAVALEAARSFVDGENESSRARLADAFAEIKSELDRLSGSRRRIFAEAHHGGMLQDDIGFYEHDWPQMVCDIIRGYLAHPGAIMSLDMPANLFRYYRDRFPSFFQEVRAWIESGRLEILNGMIGQPYTNTHSMENTLSQFLSGQEELTEILGSPAQIFATEEYCLGPAMPQIFRAAGIAKAVHAVRLHGNSKTNSPAVRQWHGLGGASVAAIEHPDLCAPGISTGYFLALPTMFANSAAKNRETIAIFNIPDFGWNVLFRDEIFTGLQFGNPLFEMVRFEEFMQELPAADEPAQTRWEDTFHSVFTHYPIRGQIRSYYEELRDFEIRLVASELDGALRGEPYPTYRAAWNDYLLGSSHDYTLVGAGFNGWYGSTVRSIYPGPLQLAFPRTLESLMGKRLAEWKEKFPLFSNTDSTATFLTNLHGFPIPDPDQPEKNLPPFSSRELAPSTTDSLPQTIQPGLLDNGILQCRIDPEIGSLAEVTCDGVIVWSDNRKSIHLPGQSLQTVESSFRESCELDGVQTQHHLGCVVDGDQKTIGYIETRYTLARGSRDLLVEVTFCPTTLPPRGEFDWEQEWNGTIRYVVPNLGKSGEMIVSQGNALFEARPDDRDPGSMGPIMPDATAHVISPEALGYKTADGTRVWLYNAGYPTYIVYKDRVEQLLRMPGEQSFKLRFGLGFGEAKLSGIQRSRALLFPAVPTRTSLPSLPLSWNNPRIGLLRIEPLPDQNRWWFFNFSEHQETVAFVGSPGMPDESRKLAPHSLFSISLPTSAKPT